MLRAKTPMIAQLENAVIAYGLLGRRETNLYQSGAPYITERRLKCGS